MTDRDRQSLRDIINSANLAADYLNGKTQVDFEGDRILQDEIVRPKPPLDCHKRPATRSLPFPGHKSSA